MSTETHDQLTLTIASLQEKLAEAEQLIEAIRSGQVDAFAVQHDGQSKIFTLQSSDYAYRLLIENISEGALNITEDGLIVYCNAYFHVMLGVPYEKVVGNFIYDFIHPDSIDDFQALFGKALGGQSKGELQFGINGRTISVYVSLTSLYPHLPTVGVIVSNLTEKHAHARDTADKNKFIEALLDASPDLIMVLDRDLRFISFNDKAIAQFKFEKNETGLGKYVMDLFPNMSAETELAALQDALHGKQQFISEREIFQDGKYYDMYAVPIRTNELEYAAMLTLREVTDDAKNKLRLQDANTLLQNRNAFIETIIEASHEMIAVYDKDLVLLTMNKAAEEFSGLKKEDVIGTKLRDFYPNVEGTKAESDLLRAINGEFISNAPYPTIFNGRRIRNYITPLRNSKGKVYAALAIGQDVTEIMQSQEALQKSQAHFKLLFNTSPVAKSITCQQDGTIIDVNPAWEKMFKRDKADVIGKSMQSIGLEGKSITAPDEKKSNRSYATAHGIDLEYTIAPGKKIFAYTDSVKFEVDGKPALLSATIDTTQRRKDEEKIKAAMLQLGEQNETLKKINNELASFTYIASHDLQEPLRKIQTFSHRIMEKDAESFSTLTRSYFDRIANAAARMQQLIADLLDYSRTNTSDYDFVPTDLNQTVQEVRTNLRELIIENKVSLRVGDLPVVNAIPSQAAQLFSNLLINSIKYKREGVRPEISVDARLVEGSTIDADLTLPDNQFWEIAVQDNGIGFDQQHAEKIFGLFQRLHGKLEYEGTGIGLAICKKIIDNHKGHIKAIGKPGEGAEFLIYWPAREHDEV